MKGSVRRLRATGTTSWAPVIVVVLATLVIRSFQLLAFKVASVNQAATGPSLADGNKDQYYVYAPSPASPGLGPVLGNWDGQWYMRIASAGYPRADQVQSAQDAWVSAFPPGFSVVARGTMVLTGLPFVWAALLMNTVLTLAAVVLLYRTLRSSGLATGVCVAAGIGVSLLPASPVLVAAYSEALALLLVILTLQLLLTHRYLVASVAILALAFTRPVAIAFVPAVLAHSILRWRADGESVRRREWGAMGVAMVVAALSPWMWPSMAARLFGVPDGTEYIGSARTEQVLSGLGSGYLTNALAGSGIRGLVVVSASALLALGVPLLLALRLGWPLEVVVWGASYVAMLIVVTPPSPSILRYLVLAAPLLVVLFAALVAHPSPVKTAVLLLVVGAFLWFQWLWILDLFIFDPTSRLAP